MLVLLLRERLRHVVKLRNTCAAISTNRLLLLNLHASLAGETTNVRLVHFVADGSIVLLHGPIDIFLEQSCTKWLDFGQIHSRFDSLYLGKRQKLNICNIIFIEIACGEITNIAAKSISMHANLRNELTMA